MVFTGFLTINEKKMESPQLFLQCAGIEDPQQKECALVLRDILAQNLGICTDYVYASSHPNTILKSAKNNWDDNNFIIDLEERLGAKCKDSWDSRVGHKCHRLSHECLHLASNHRGF